jgi:Tfp pilus assembly protein PilF
MGYLRVGFFLALASLVYAQGPYELLKAKDYSGAIDGFQKALELAPSNASLRKDLAYTLLKIGDTDAARDQFEEAMKLDPADDHVALEFAFLCYETKEQVKARRIFQRLAEAGNATAKEAFENVDRPLREGIARRSQTVELDPQNFSAHEELGHLAEQRDELELAREHYEKAWRLKSQRRDLLLDLGRVLKEQNRIDEAEACLLAASRGAEPRVAEEARELLPARYPYVYEFEKALALDPPNAGLRRELAYLHLAMSHAPEAEKQFEVLVQDSADDLLSVAQLGLLRLSRGDEAGAMPLLEKVLGGSDDDLADRVRSALHLPKALKRREEQPRAQVSEEAKQLAAKSLEKGYLKDAVKYLRVAHENDPVDFDVMLKLGWAYNIMKDDDEAIKWFNVARRSPDEKLASEASQAYKNLKPALERFRATVWVSSTFSSRWHDDFTYAQAKTELRLDRVPLRFYASARFIGDARGAVDARAGLGPQYLSERSLILAAGAATIPWRGLTGWFEAGEAFRYRTTATDTGRIVPDYRGGLSFSKGFGGMLASGAHGRFAETNVDGVFVSRFGNDLLLYAQARAGYTLRSAEGMKGFHGQFLWNFNITADAESQYWANFAEMGPGFKFRFEQLPASLLFSVNVLHGVYLVNEGNPRRPNYNELRVGVWYAFSN